MDANSYALGLISVLVGLALTDVAVSLHRLLRRGRAVRWDARVALAAVFVVILIVDMWFQSFRLGQTEVTRDFLFFLSLFVEYGLLVMAACAVLPDECGDGETVNLAAFYDSERVYLWSVLVAFEVSHILHSLYLAPQRLVDGTAFDWAVFVGPILLFTGMLMVRDRRFHVVALVLLIVGTLARAQLHRLGG